MTHGSLFSGIGGFDLAAAWIGFENKWQVEINEYCQKVLAKNFPEVKRYGDIRTVGKHNLERVDIISGGFPCQPFSVAGNRKGKEDDRFLWPEMLRVIREMQPSFIVGENVTGIINLAFDQVLTELENEGYTCESFIIPACAVNAPHRRDRVWIIAYSKSNIDRRNTGEFQEKNELEKTQRQEKRIFKSGNASEGNDKERIVANTDKFNDDGPGLNSSSISQQVAAAIFDVISQTENCV